MHRSSLIFSAIAAAALGLAGCSGHAASPAAASTTVSPSVSAVAKAVVEFGPGARFTITRGRITGRAVRSGVAVLMVDTCRANGTQALQYITVPAKTALALHTDVFVLQGPQGSVLVIPR